MNELGFMRVMVALLVFGCFGIAMAAAYRIEVVQVENVKLHTQVEILSKVCRNGAAPDPDYRVDAESPPTRPKLR